MADLQDFIDSGQIGESAVQRVLQRNRALRDVLTPEWSKPFAGMTPEQANQEAQILASGKQAQGKIGPGYLSDTQRLGEAAGDVASLVAPEAKVAMAAAVPPGLLQAARKAVPMAAKPADTMFHVTRQLPYPNGAIEPTRQFATETAAENWLKKQMRDYGDSRSDYLIEEKSRLPQLPFAPAGIGPASEAAPSGITAYHGSPHEFDRFDATKTNQGIWVTEDPEAAARYKFGSGKVYKVNINAPVESFIDHNRPINQQSESVRHAIAGIEKDFDVAPRKDASGGTFYADLARKLAGDEPFLQGLVKANNLLRDRGIPGITHGNGVHLVFDDKLIDIKQRQ